MLGRLVRQELRVYRLQVETNDRIRWGTRSQPESENTVTAAQVQNAPTFETQAVAGKKVDNLVNCLYVVALPPTRLLSEPTHR